MFEVKEIVELLDAVCVSNKFIAPPETPDGKAVIADKELLLANNTAIDYPFGLASFTALTALYHVPFLSNLPSSMSCHSLSN